jgi:aspergillopepsin I
MMHILSNLVLASAAFSALGAAVPLEKRNTFSVKQQPNTSYKKSGPAALAKALGKYNAPLPSAIVVAASDDGTVIATPDQGDEEYLCPVTIGGQTLNLDFDTGSADL